MPKGKWSQSPSRIPAPGSARRISRNSSARSRRWKGRGALHGGQTTVRSAVGAGSTFTVRLPIEAGSGQQGVGAPLVGALPERAPTRGAPTVQPSRAAPLILIVEDDDPTADLVAAYLEGAGYETARARDGEEGLSRARDLMPDGITLDVMMPVMDGWTFLERAAADTALAGIPVIVVSLAGDLKHGVSLGAAAVLGKPVRR